MTIPKITPYSGGVANPDGSQTQTEFTQNMFDQLSYEAELSTELNNTVDGINDTATQVDADATSAAQSAAAAEAAVSGLNYQGLWPDTGGSADKGDTYQTQVSGTPTGQYFTALQNTTVDPVGDDVNWRTQITMQGVVVNGKDIQDLLSSETNIVIRLEHHSGGIGKARTYRFDQLLEKTMHDGIHYISNTVPFIDLGDFLKGSGESDPSGVGVWVSDDKDETSKVGFIIDDGLSDQHADVPPVFESRGVRCGFAIIPELLGNSGRMSASNINDLYRRGFEILGHSITDLRTTTSELLSAAEIRTSYERLRKICGISGYVASQSELSAVAVREAEKVYDYAFSVLSVPGEYSNDTFDGKSYYDLSRVNLDGSNSQYGIPAAQLAAIEGGNVVFYEHLYTGVATLESLLDEILQYKSIDISLPRDCFVKSIVAKSQSENKSKILNVEQFTSTSGSINTTSGALPVTGDSFFFSPSDIGLNKVFQLNRNCEEGKTYTASMSMRLSGGDMNASLGMYFYDSSGDRIDEVNIETDSADLDSNERRYFVKNTAPTGSVTMRVFIRVGVAANGTVTVISPRISSTGSVIEGNDSQDFSYKHNLPTQDVTVGRSSSSYPDYSLQLPTVDNHLFSMSGNEIEWKKSGVYSLVVYFEGASPDGCTGLMALLSESQNLSRSSVGVVSGNALRANGSGNSVIKVTAGDKTTATVRVKSNDALDGLINIVESGNSAVEVQKVG